MKYIIELPKSLKHKIDRIIEGQDYGDFNTFALSALENQILLENEGTVGPVKDRVKVMSGSSPIEREQMKSFSKGEILKVFSLSDNSVRELQPPKYSAVIRGPLWGQFYKFFPCKLGLRVLLYLSGQGLPTVEEFRKKTAEIAVKFATYLRETETRFIESAGEKSSTSLPTNDAQSRKRFMNQFLIYIRPSDNLLDGMLARLNMINVVEEGNLLKVGITNFGFEFSKLENPLLDDGELTPALSKAEIDFLLNHLESNLEEEYKDMIQAMCLIKNGVERRTALNQAMAAYYRKYFGNREKWSEEMINTMRAGIVSRLCELNLVRKTKAGQTVFYKLTDSGASMIDIQRCA